MRKGFLALFVSIVCLPSQVFAQDVAEAIILENVSVLSIQYVDPTPDRFDQINVARIEFDQPLDERCPAPRRLELSPIESTWNAVILDELRQARDTGEPLASVGYTFIVANGFRFCTVFAVEP